MVSYRRPRGFQNQLRPPASIHLIVCRGCVLERTTAIGNVNSNEVEKAKRGETKQVLFYLITILLHNENRCAY